jgi:hypothetical protein
LASPSSSTFPPFIFYPPSPPPSAHKLSDTFVLLPKKWLSLPQPDGAVINAVLVNAALANLAQRAGVQLRDSLEMRGALRCVGSGLCVFTVGCLAMLDIRLSLQFMC